MIEFADEYVPLYIRGVKDISVLFLIIKLYLSDISDGDIDRRGRFQRKNSLTDLHEAVLRNCEKSVRDSLASGVPIDLVDHAGQTALYYACERGYTELVELLLKHGASHTITDLNHTSPLSIAAKMGHSDIVLTLLMNGANFDDRAHDQTTALYHASYEGRTSCAFHLVRYGACVHFAKNSGASPLFVAARNGHDRIVECLLENGAKANQCQQDERSPLHTALIYNRVECVKLLLQNNADCLIHQSDMNGWTPLHFLAKKGSMEAAQVFFHYLGNCKESINLNEKDSFGNTALHIAGFNEKLDFAQYLISKGLDPKQENSYGWTFNSYLAKCEEKNEMKKLPSLAKEYLQCLLSKHRICFTSEAELPQIEVESYVKELLSDVAKGDPLFGNSLIRSGSYYEGTRVGAPDEFDYMINLTEIQRLTRFEENHLDPSGFGRLYPNDTDEARQKLSPYLEPITQCISSEKVRKRFYQLLTSSRSHVIRKEISSKFHHLKFEWTSGDKRCGTAIHAEWYGTQFPYLQIKIDVVPCLTIYSWPQSANFACPLDEPEFQTIPRSPKIDETYLWRISTSRAELKEFHCLVADQVNGYLSLKSLRILKSYEHTIDNVKYLGDELITSYMFKNEFFHEVKRYPHGDQWKNGCLIHRVSSILKRLHKNIVNGSIKSYYIKNYNVIDIDDYQRFRKFQINYIRILHSHLQEKVREMNKKTLRRNTLPTTTEPNIRRHMLRNRSATIDH